MSLAVELSRLLELAAGYRTVPMLLTCDADGRPRAAAVGVSWQDTVAQVRAGHRSVANAAARPLVSLLWPAPPGERFALLVDGEADAVVADPAPAPEPGRRTPKPGGLVVVRATSAILHAVTKPPA